MERKAMKILTRSAYEPMTMCVVKMQTTGMLAASGGGQGGVDPDDPDARSNDMEASFFELGDAIDPNEA